METDGRFGLSAIQEKPATHERRVSEFQDALAQITNTPATVELLQDNAYTEQAISELIRLNEQVLQSFKKAGSIEVFTSDKEREDAAFNHFNLPNLAEVLDQVSAFNEKLQQLDQLLQNSNRQDLLIEKVRVVFVPTDEKTIQQGQRGRELAPKLLIDRTKAILVTLSENFNIDVFDPTQLKITEGEVTDNMIRQTPYRFLDIPTLQRQILVNDEEGNATFVFDSTKLQELHISSQQLSEAMSKSELKTLIENNPSIGQTLIYTQNFINRLIKAIEQPASKSKKQKAAKENADYLQPVESAPEGWMNAGQLKLYFGVAYMTVRKAIGCLTNLECALYQNEHRRKTTFYSPDAIEQIRQELGDLLTTESAPEGWMNLNQLIQFFDISSPTIKQTLDDLTNLESVFYKDASGQTSQHYSPDAIEQIRQELGDLLTTKKAPESWMSTWQISQHLKVDSRKLKKYLKELYDLEWHKYKDNAGRVVVFYSPDAIKQIANYLTEKKSRK